MAETTESVTQIKDQLVLNGDSNKIGIESTYTPRVSRAHAGLENLFTRPSDYDQTLAKLHYQISVHNPDRPVLCPDPIKISDRYTIRRATLEDAEEVSEFNGLVHGGREYFETHTMAYFKPMKGYENPTANYSCQTVIVDSTKNNKIVSCFMSIPQLWIYGESDINDKTIICDGKKRVPLICLRPEYIGTLAEYRGQGLIQKHFDVHHKWATALGSQIQFIGGLPIYYRRFGYENTPRRQQGHCGTIYNVNKIKMVDGESNVFSFRLANASSESDISFLTRVARQSSLARQNIWFDSDESGWRDQVGGRPKGCWGNRSTWIIEKSSQIGVIPVGFVQMGSYYTSSVERFELDLPENTEYTSWSDVTPALIRWLPRFDLEYFQPTRETSKLPSKVAQLEKDLEHMIARNVETPKLGTIPALPSEESFVTEPRDLELDDTWKFELCLGSNHPCYKSVPPSTFPEQAKGLYWFTRIPDHLLFLRTIEPVLTYRLKKNPTFQAYSGTVLISKQFRPLSNSIIIEISKGSIKNIYLSPKETNKAYLRKFERLDMLILPEPNKLFLGEKTFDELYQETNLNYGIQHTKVVDCLFPKLVNDEMASAMD